jgi:hypothetical protein
MPPKVDKPKKRGRKPKVKPIVEKPPPKKRGRKPKGGKIINKVNITNINNEKIIPNVILHLKCSTKQIDDVSISNLKYNPTLENIKSYNEYDDFQLNEIQNIQNTPPIEPSDMKPPEIDPAHCFNLTKNTDPTPKNNSHIENKLIWEKIRKLKNDLHSNNLNDNQCACFWCTFTFDNPAIYIPKNYKNETYGVYGCFCSPECACAFLKEELIDSSTIWERYALLNNLYGHIYNYTKNIKPAPNPYYTLDRFYGNLTIQEYRKLLTNDRLLIVVHKPILKISPDMYEENNEIPSIYSNLLNDEKKQEIIKQKYRLKSNIKKKTKANSIQHNFNLV